MPSAEWGPALGVLFAAWLFGFGFGRVMGLIRAQASGWFS